MRRVDAKKAAHKFNRSLEAFPTLEGMVVKGLKEKRLLPE
jgi:hypothetical protein